MTNGKNKREKLVEIAEDENVAMKTKISLMAASQADMWELLGKIDGKIDAIVTDHSTRIVILEERQNTNTKEIETLRKLSNRNDWIGSLAALFIAIMTAIGIYKG